tara:strand:- start:591 stop:791 length:201 start_codon:yes stop_codon:yes gene_type:complete
MGWYVLFDDFIIGEAPEDEFGYKPYGVWYNEKFNSFKEAKAALVNYHLDELSKAKANLKRARSLKK